jgi:hypothetical protein
MVFRILNLFCLLVLAGTTVFSHEQFVQFSYYDQLTWSDDGNQLAFRCILLDESQPDQLKTNLLVKDLKTEQLICLNPQPERFIISQDRKYLLFSSNYGLYLVSLKEKNRAVQIYFRSPAATWFFQDFGFLKDGMQFYMDRYDYATMKTAQETYQIQSPKFPAQFIGWAETKKIKKKSRLSRFDYHVDEMKGKLQIAIRIKDSTVEFLSQPESEDPGNFKLVYQPARKNPFRETLIDRCRPRLLSVNPDSTEFIVSVFTQGDHKTFRLSFASKKLTLIENKRYFSISWLDAKQYICLTEEGLFLRNVNLSVNNKINQWQIPAWCQGIHLDLPKYELQVGFEQDKHRAEQQVAQLQKSGFPARIKYIKDQATAGYRIRVGGFRSREQAQVRGDELKKKGFNFWIDKFNDSYDYFNSMRSEEQKSYGDKTAIIQYRIDNYLRSRILLVGPKNTRKIIVDEMNNIPGRVNW